MGITHFTLNFRLRHKCSHGVDYDNVKCTASYEHITDFESLFTGIRLRNDEFTDINAKVLRIYGVKCMFCIDKCGLAARLLRFCYNM